MCLVIELCGLKSLTFRAMQVESNKDLIFAETLLWPFTDSPTNPLGCLSPDKVKMYIKEGLFQVSLSCFV